MTEIDDFGITRCVLGSDPRQWPPAWRRFANAYAEEYRIYYLVRESGSRELLNRVGHRVVQYSNKAHELLSYRSLGYFDAKMIRIRKGINKPLKEA